MQKLKNPEVNLNSSKKLDLPPKNSLVPTNFDILPSDSALSTSMKLLQVWEDSELWYKKDDNFKRPKAIINLTLYTRDLDLQQQGRGRLFAELWDECFTEFRREFSYMAGLVKMSFSS